jgi:superfamily II DNA/RNA helicase
VKNFANILKFRTVSFTATSDFDTEYRKLRLGSEILICTPGRLLELMRREYISFQSLSYMILDEADVLFEDETFPLQPIGLACLNKTANITPPLKTGTHSKVVGRVVQQQPPVPAVQPVPTQFIFTSATLPQHIVSKIIAEFPDVKTIYGPGLHRVSPSIEERLIDCSGKMISYRHQQQEDEQNGGSRGSSSSWLKKAILLKTGKRSYEQVLENKKEALLNVLLTSTPIMPTSDNNLMNHDDESNDRELRRSAREISSRTQGTSSLSDNSLATTSSLERTIIFCNTVEQCRIVENTLTRYDRQGIYWEVLPHHSAIDAKQRDDNLYEFSKPLLKKSVILICTDRTSRGMDFNEVMVSKHFDLTLAWFACSNSLSLSLSLSLS